MRRPAASGGRQIQVRQSGPQVAQPGSQPRQPAA
jgi:hypothetical protein